MKRLKGTTFVLSALIALLVAGCSKENYQLLTDGECYTYGRGSWINHECFKSEEEAKAKMDALRRFTEEREAHENRSWKAVGN